jgi:hypothetical protein
VLAAAAVAPPSPSPGGPWLYPTVEFLPMFLIFFFDIFEIKCSPNDY